MGTLGSRRDVLDGIDCLPLWIPEKSTATEISIPCSILSLASGSWTYYGYDAVRRLNALTQDIAGTTYDVNYGFGFNPAS